MDRRDYFNNHDNGLTFNKDKMSLIWQTENEEGEEIEIEFPAHFEVCGTCNGKGTHVNPSIDAHGITADEWEEDWDYEDRENYMNGFYDVDCYECHGENVVPVISEGYLNKELKVHLEHYHEVLADLNQMRAEQESERKLGA